MATDKALSVQTYDGLNQMPLVNAVLPACKGGTVLVLGRSNTVPALLNLLTGTTAYAQLPDTEYDNLYLVTVFEKGRADVLHLKYGK